MTIKKCASTTVAGLFLALPLTGCSEQTASQPPANAAEKQTPTETPRGATAKKGGKPVEMMGGDVSSP